LGMGEVPFFGVTVAGGEFLALCCALPCVE
jgi:hypothetical protein